MESRDAGVAAYPGGGPFVIDRKRGGLVYSSAEGRMCPRCERPLDACACPPAEGAPSTRGAPVRIRRETKGRKGKGVTVISDIPLPAGALKAFAKELKTRCGSGGTVKEGSIEIQGDHRETIAAELEKRGWKVKRVGG